MQQISPEQAARSVIARLNFTAAAPGIGPDHGDNHLADDETGAPFDIPVGTRFGCMPMAERSSRGR